METVKFGKTGMQVSKICLGCMTYGSTKWREWVLEEEASRPFIREALEKRHQFLRHRGRLFARRERGNRRPRAQGIRQAAGGGDRDQGAWGDGAGGQRQGPVAQAHHGGDRRLAEAPRHGLRRSLPDPPLRSADADGGDARGAERRRARRQGALYRRLVDVRVAVRAHARHRARQGPRRVRVDAELLQPRLSRGRARDDAALRPRRDRRHPVVADGARLSRRLGHRRGRVDGARPHRPVQRHAGPGLAAGRGDPQAGRRDGGEAEHRSRRWSRSPGCCRSRSSPRRSSAPRSRITSPTRSPRPSSSSTPAPSPGSRSPIIASRWRGTRKEL